DPNGLNCAAASSQSAALRPAAPQALTPGAALPPITPNSNPNGVTNNNLGRSPGTLGTLSGPAPAAVAGTDNRQYDAAMNLLARAFAEQIKKYPKAPRGADSMLKMGQALVAQGRKENGCTAFAAIRRTYPDASPSTLTAATNARRAANCS